jgi:hypothetical protein
LGSYSIRCCLYFSRSKLIGRGSVRQRIRSLATTLGFCVSTISASIPLLCGFAIAASNVCVHISLVRWRSSWKLAKAYGLQATLEYAIMPLLSIPPSSSSSNSLNCLRGSILLSAQWMNDVRNPLFTVSRQDTWCCVSTTSWGLFWTSPTPASPRT